MVRPRSRTVASRATAEVAREELANVRETESARNRARIITLEAEKLEDAETIKDLRKKVEVLKIKVKDSEHRGSHKVLQKTMMRKSYEKLETRAKFDRINSWMNSLKELNDNSDLSQEACSALSRRLLKFEENENEKLTVEQTSEFFLTLGITQNKFRLLYQILKSYEIPVPFSPYSFFEQFIKQTPPGKYVTIKTDGSTGRVSSDIKELMKIRLERLYNSEQLVFETTPSSNVIRVKICLVGDKGKGTTKFCFQPQVKDKNHSFKVLSVIALWDGPDNREFMDYYLNTAYSGGNCEMINGSVIQQLKDCKRIKLNTDITCLIEYYLTGDFLFIYSFMGFKGPASNYFCFYCEYYSRTPNEVGHFHKNKKTCWKDFDFSSIWDLRSMTEDVNCELIELNKRGFKQYALMEIEYNNILMPLLHIFMGLTVDIQKKLKELLHAEDADKMIQFFKSIGIRMRDYWEAFSGNAVSKLMKNMGAFLDVLPNSTNGVTNMKDILNKLSNVYLLIFVANVDDISKLKSALEELVRAYMNGQISKNMTITPKAHTLICHAIGQLGTHGTLMLFSEQGQEALHNIINKDVIRFQSMEQVERQMELIMRFHSLRVAFADDK
uniref:Reverse transcriptase domain-containing protein n=1 Tax=Rhabditophanes sp. KR3021 TaxID=114890 RepID=A0AC35U6S1_9BILA